VGRGRICVDAHRCPAFCRVVAALVQAGVEARGEPPQWSSGNVRDAHDLLACYRFQLLFDLGDYATTYRATRDAYLKAANELKLATGPYKAARDAYVAGTATYTKSLYE
jgi:hypothetical protein